MTLGCYHRYAIYLAPGPDTALGRFCNAWLGGRPDTGERLDPPAIGSLNANDIEEVTRQPSRYGFHATLKPPFRLTDGTDRQELDLFLQEFAAGQTPIVMERLQLSSIGQFLALTPAKECAKADHLAELCVRTFDRYRAPLSAEERSRRLRSDMTQKQQSYLDDWGYPYVFDEFRFHMTLTGPLPADQIAMVKESLNRSGGAIFRQEIRFEDICLFGDPGDGGRFRLVRRYALGRSTHPESP